MIKPLERKRRELEMKRVLMSAEEMEFKIMERQADIERLELEIEKQKQKAEEIKKELEA